MLVKYYKNDNLKYTSRNRYSKIDTSIIPIKEEEQFSIFLGDGANTSIKTYVNNICDYVTIDDTRWFVTSYTYMNGGQVRLNLQRDVVGEFGISSYFGNIERGYTDTILQYRKELSLNQILKNRIPIKDTSSKSGNLIKKEINGDEIYGILYIVKPSKSTDNSVNINIPEFAPATSNLPLIKNGSFSIHNIIENIDIEFLIQCKFTGMPNTLKGCIVKMDRDNVTVEDYSLGHKSPNYILTLQGSLVYDYLKEVKRIFTELSNSIFNCFYLQQSIPSEDISYENLIEYRDKIVVDNNIYYRNTITTTNEKTSEGIDNAGVKNVIINSKYNFENTGEQAYYDYNNKTSYDKSSINFTQLSKEESGTLTINLKENFIDEPYYICVIPLFNGKFEIQENNTKKEYQTYKDNCFTIFNKIIEQLSGENGYLVDAQIYPYCPEISKVNNVIQNAPIFNILSTSFVKDCKVNINPFNDIKKEYIQRSYSVISPEKSGKFDFHYYDYCNKKDIVDNFGELNIKIKTALKPFAIISSAVIQPTSNSLIGLTYESDLRGCQPSSNGFECSIASNAFETYKRQNSNYQQIFALQQEQLQLEHNTERVNEKTSAIVNTISGTFMGAVAGGSLGVDKISKAIGASIGGSIAGSTVGSLMGVQYQQNEKLREYEEYLQKQKFNLDIGTIKKLPNSVSRISSFNEIITKDFYYVIEVYECSNDEKIIVNNFIDKYGYGIGVFGRFDDFHKNGFFLRGNLLTSNLQVNLHNIAVKEIAGGIYYNDTE